MPTHLALHSAPLRLHQIRGHGISGVTATASDEVLQIVTLRGGRGGGRGGRGRASGRFLVVVKEIGDGGGEREEAETGESGACDGGGGGDGKGRNRWDEGVDSGAGWMRTGRIGREERENR